MVAQLVTKFPAFYGNRMFITVSTRARHLSLSWDRPIHSTHSPPRFLKIHFWVCFTRKRERRKPYGPVHVCLSVAFFLGGRQPVWPGALPPRPFPRMFLRWGLAPCASCSRSSAPLPGLSILSLAHQGFGNKFSALVGLRPRWVAPPLVHAVLWHIRAASLWCSALRAYPNWQCPLGLAFAVWTPLDLYHFMLVHPGLRSIWTAPEGVLPPTGLGHFRGLSPLQGTPR
jgi:hypothetical protein